MQRIDGQGNLGRSARIRQFRLQKAEVLVRRPHLKRLSIALAGKLCYLFRCGEVGTHDCSKCVWAAAPAPDLQQHSRGGAAVARQQVLKVARAARDAGADDPSEHVPLLKPAVNLHVELLG